MSAKIMGQVWDYVLTHNEQMILLALADHAEQDGSEIRPAVARVMWKTGLSESTIRRVLKDMRERGVLVVTRKARDHYPTEYRMVLASLARKAPYVPQYRGVTETPREVSAEPTGVSKRPSGVSEPRHPNRPRTRPPQTSVAAIASQDARRTGDDKEAAHPVPLKVVRAGSPELAAWLARRTA